MKNGIRLGFDIAGLVLSTAIGIVGLVIQKNKKAELDEEMVRRLKINESDKDDIAKKVIEKFNTKFSVEEPKTE